MAVGFLDLTQEIRDRVYELAFTSQPVCNVLDGIAIVHIVGARTAKLQNNDGIINTLTLNKQIYKEALVVLFKYYSLQFPECESLGKAARRHHGSAYQPLSSKPVRQVNLRYTMYDIHSTKKKMGMIRSQPTLKRACDMIARRFPTCERLDIILDLKLHVEMVAPLLTKELWIGEIKTAWDTCWMRAISSLANIRTLKAVKIEICQPKPWLERALAKKRSNHDMIMYGMFHGWFRYRLLNRDLKEARKIYRKWDWWCKLLFKSLQRKMVLVMLKEDSHKVWEKYLKLCEYYLEWKKAVLGRSAVKAEKARRSKKARKARKQGQQ